MKLGVSVIVAIVIGLCGGAVGATYFSVKHYKPIVANLETDLDDSTNSLDQARSDNKDLEEELVNTTKQYSALVLRWNNQQRDITNGLYNVYATLSSCPITTCNDNSCSNSVGSGTCSHHDGVKSYN